MRDEENHFNEGRRRRRLEKDSNDHHSSSSKGVFKVHAEYS